MNIDKKFVLKVSLVGLGVVGIGVAIRWWLGERVDQTPSTGPEIGGTGSFDIFTTDYTPAQAAAFRTALPERAKKYAGMFVEAGRTYGVPPVVLSGLMKTETGYGEICPDAVCRGVTKHDFGLMQINDIHKEFFRKTVNGRPAYEDPYSSIMYGAATLRECIRFAKKPANSSGRYPVYNAGRAEKYGCNPALIQKSALAKGGATVPDRRPVSGMLALRAGIAGYNAGLGYPPIAIGCGLDPDVVTHKGRYVASVIGEAERLIGLMRATGTV